MNIDITKAKSRVKYIVNRLLLEHTPPASLSREDYEQQGLLIILESANKYRPGTQSFLSYASNKVRFGLIDYSMMQTFGPSANLRRKYKKEGRPQGGEIPLCSLCENWEEVITDRRVEDTRVLIEPGKVSEMIEAINTKLRSSNPMEGICYAPSRKNTR